MKKTKRNHFNPSSYLQHFSNSKGDIFRYSKSEDRIPTKPHYYKSFGYKFNLYSQELEEALASSVDNSYNDIIKNIEENLTGKSLAIEFMNLEKLAYFIAVQMTRSPKVKEFIKNEIMPVIESNFTAYLSVEEYFSKGVLILAKSISEEFKVHTWELIKPGKCKFISSDDVISLATTDINDKSERMGIGSKDAIKFFPLSENLGLRILSDNKSWIKDAGKEVKINIVKNCSEREVKFLNGMVFASATEYVYASSKELIISAKREAEKIIVRSNELLQV